MSELEDVHMVSSTPADTIGQWFNAGGMISYYDYPLETYMNVSCTSPVYPTDSNACKSTIGLVQNHTVAMSTLQEKMRRILGVKYDLGLFDNPYIPESIDAEALTAQHVPLTLEAAQKGIVLLENHNATLPLDPTHSPYKKLALIGPFIDQLNYGDYSGQFGEYPTAYSSTLREGVLNALHAANSSTEVVSAWGANSWYYNAQYAIPGYHLSTPNGTIGGLQATYFADTNFSKPMVRKTEVPVRDWGLYPPPGLPSNNFSAVWEGTLTVPISTTTQGWLGVGISWNATANLYVDGKLHYHAPLTTDGNFLSNIPSRAYSLQNSTAPPPGSAPFTFVPGATHHVRLEFQSWNLYQKLQNVNSLNAEVMLFWNLVSPTTSSDSALSQAISVASSADAIVLGLGAAWNSDGENGDRGTMGLSGNQTALAHALVALNKPIILILSGGRPFAIPELYNASSAVLTTWFGGQSAGKAIADVLFGNFNPGGRLPLTVPRSVGQMPVFYNFKGSSHLASYLDLDLEPAYPFGYGLSYTNFTLSNFTSSSSTFNPASDTLAFSFQLRNTGPCPGSHVPQLYLLQRVSQISQPVLQLISFDRVYLNPGEERTVQLDVDVQRYLRILNRKYEWQVEKGKYVFSLRENGGMEGREWWNVTLRCV